MNKKNFGKLSLKKEAIATLNNEDMAQINGGKSSVTNGHAGDVLSGGFCYMYIPFDKPDTKDVLLSEDIDLFDFDGNLLD